MVFRIYEALHLPGLVSADRCREKFITGVSQVSIILNFYQQLNGILQIKLTDIPPNTTITSTGSWYTSPPAAIVLPFPWVAAQQPACDISIVQPYKDPSILTRQIQSKGLYFPYNSYVDTISQAVSLASLQQTSAFNVPNITRSQMCEKIFIYASFANQMTSFTTQSPEIGRAHV